MCVWSDITAVQDYEMHYINAWLNRCVFNLDLNRDEIYKSTSIVVYSQQYVLWVNMINFSFRPKIIRILSKDHVPWRHFVNVLL